MTPAVTSADTDLLKCTIISQIRYEDTCEMTEFFDNPYHLLGQNIAKIFQNISTVTFDQKDCYVMLSTTS